MRHFRVQGNENRHGGARYIIIERAFSERAMHVELGTLARGATCAFVAQLES